eukprot:TRINITY_DN280_c0_g1_i2.p1 TRINITY_DN280_c0_g1~~TRINITY_DN280_c0_g1_i2.p1  ORF type:complete len:537 (-),score=67.48 TRINITY_DN280_c0_g1_i2:136-1698(-)
MAVCLRDVLVLLLLLGVVSLGRSQLLYTDPDTGMIVEEYATSITYDGNANSFDIAVSGLLIAEKFGDRAPPTNGSLVMVLSRDEYPAEPVIRRLYKAYPNVVAFIAPTYYGNHVPGEQEYTTDASDTSDIVVQVIAFELRVYDRAVELATDESLPYVTVSVQGQENPWRTLYSSPGFMFFSICFIVITAAVFLFGSYVFVDRLLNRAEGVWWNLSNTITLFYVLGSFFRLLLSIDFSGYLHIYPYPFFAFLLSIWFPFVLSGSFLFLLFWNIQVNSAGLHTRVFRIPAFIGVGTAFAVEAVSLALRYGLKIDVFVLQKSVYFVLIVISLVFHFYVTLRMRNYIRVQEKTLGSQVLYLRHTNNIFLFVGFLTILNLFLALGVVVLDNTPSMKFMFGGGLISNFIGEVLIFYIFIMRKQARYSNMSSTHGSRLSSGRRSTKLNSSVGSSVRGTAETSFSPPETVTRDETTSESVVNESSSSGYKQESTSESGSEREGSSSSGVGSSSSGEGSGEVRVDMESS